VGRGRGTSLAASGAAQPATKQQQEQTMSRSPGHQQHPEHKVVETPVDARMTVELNGEQLADSRDVVKVNEDGQPARFYFARSDVKTEHLKASDTTTLCPFKGRASYFHIRHGDHQVEDAAWSYEEPYDEHAGLRGRLAFDESRSDGLLIRSLP
jgi:uncharacterized protein (DUF427 family)